MESWPLENPVVQTTYILFRSVNGVVCILVICRQLAIYENNNLTELEEELPVIVTVCWWFTLGVNIVC